MRVSEIFTSIQGEGTLWVGKPAVFVRLFGCPHKCSFCDTKYSWNGNAPDQSSIRDILTEIEAECFKYPYRNLIITGGEPLYGENGEELADLINHLPRDMMIMIETSGTFCPDDFFEKIQREIFITISPKLKDMNSLQEPHKDIFDHASEIKFLIGDGFKEHYIDLITQFFYAKPRGVPICLQPIRYGTKEQDEVARRNAVQLALETGFSLSAQLHKFMKLP